MSSWAGKWFKDGTYIYIDTGERYKGIPARIVLGDPLKGVAYYDAAGREMRPA